MKLIKLLPILAADAKKARKNKNQDNRTVERFVASQITDECSDKIPSSGGDFDTVNEGMSGTIFLNNYKNRIRDL